MDDIADLNIKVNGNPRDESQTLTFSGIPNSHDETTVMDTIPTETNSFTVEFDQDVDFNEVLIDEISAGTGEETEIYIIIKDGNGDIIKDLDGNDITDVIPVTGGKIVFPDNLPLRDTFLIIVVSASQELFELSTDFLGCVLPRTYTFNYINTIRLLFHGEIIGLFIIPVFERHKRSRKS